MVGTLLSVCAGLKLPHCPALPQVTVQLTPALPGSPVTVAAIRAWMSVFRDEGGAKPDVKATVILDVTVMVAEADLVESVIDAAVTVTVFPAGTAAGALY